MLHTKPLRLLGLLILLLALTPTTNATEATPFVMQLTRSSDNNGHRRALLQIDRVMNDLGEDKLKVVVVAYENSIHALLADNKETNQLVTKLANRGVVFRACRISMAAWGLKEDEFSLEAGFVPAGATEMVRLQTEGYRYWRP